MIAGNRHECHLVTLRAGVLAAEESLEAAKKVLAGGWAEEWSLGCDKMLFMARSQEVG